MPSVGSLQMVRRKGRRTYYQCRAQGRIVHLGTDALDAADKHARLIDNADMPPEEPASIAGLIHAWVIRFPHRTTDWYEAALIAFAETKALEKLPRTFLQDYCDHLAAQELSAETIRKYVTYASQLVRWAESQNPPWITVGILKPKLPTPRFKPRDIAPSLLPALMEALPERSGLILEWILETACRPGEAIGLTWPEVDLDRNVCVLDEHKNAHRGRTRTIYLTARAVELLQSIDQPHKDLVFRNRWGRRYTVDGLRTVLRRAGKKIGVKIRGVYDLRHTRLQDALDRGLGIEDVAALAGHADLRMIRRYAQVRDARLRRVAASLGAALDVSTRPRSSSAESTREGRGSNGKEGAGRKTQKPGSDPDDPAAHGSAAG